ncbi:Oidioi.mRNA.OKI2018_I69.PAR.g10560.t1.cds [Oikopleura dioica]|uniref:Oidioi.mRNA.OKI2018_I69.PAR.g10560.t1.cds n=1 Tax=Oikopleura dioica TaxID=34765 RepID=A0ABN7RVJ1_OIKDI|nr:Oidioi.mRNA.OKI2018_I69.PAR.g10560.t1.cds [Oikopleura dioica]
MEGKIIIFTSSYSTNKKIWKESNLVKDFLNVRKIPFFEIDLATHPKAKEELLKRLPEEYKAPPILPPQVFLNNEYLGNYESFFMATEMEFPYTFFKQEPPAGSREEQRVIEYKSKNKAIPSFI